MATIEIQNNYSHLTAPDDVMNHLWRALRFPVKGAWFSPRVQNRQWDGYQEFFKKQTGRFLTGLLPDILGYLKKTKIETKLIDSRVPVEFITETVNEQFLETIELRDYQIDYVNQCIKYQRGIIPSPTSSGKTLTLVSLVKAIKEKTPILILANRTALIEQNYEELIKYGIKNVGRYYGQRKDPNYITCATVQSVPHLFSILPKIKALFVDEIHEMTSKRSKAAFAKLENCSMRIGMSATAYKFGGTDSVQKFEVKGWIGPLLKTACTESGTLSVKELQDRDILSDAYCQFLTIKKPELLYEVYMDAVTKGIAQNNHFHKTVKSLVKKCPGRTLILVERIEHGDQLSEMIPGVGWVKGQDNLETRKHIINQLTDSKKYVAIATSGIFNTGINFFVHNLINCAGGKAEHQIIQRFGRGLRRSSDKQKLHYYDFVFDINSYLLDHSKKRIKILEREGHQVVVHPHSNVNELQFLSLE